MQNSRWNELNVEKTAFLVVELPWSSSVFVLFSFLIPQKFGGECAISSLTEEHCVLRTIRSSSREYGNERFVCFIWLSWKKKLCLYLSSLVFSATAMCILNLMRMRLRSCMWLSMPVCVCVAELKRADILWRESLARARKSCFQSSVQLMCAEQSTCRCVIVTIQILVVFLSLSLSSTLYTVHYSARPLG